ncbi:putative transcriptional regulator [Rhodococcus phage E3]|uniref:replication initiation protein n=1 Tax=Rhodococcus phage E3 TaxID=1007869 RepID=UPI0002C69F0C|nr:replication initiation protein [Rhodococcus phage E3]AEQ21099.1 putative transcriptional regulator [Rhodococcus phage E3]
MKITLPSGVVIESDEGVNVGGVEIAPIKLKQIPKPPEAQDSDVTAVQAQALRSEEARLGKVLRETLAMLREYDSPVSVSHVAQLMDINCATSSRRLIALTDTGLVERIRRGIYRTVKFAEV